MSIPPSICLSNFSMVTCEFSLMKMSRDNPYVRKNVAHQQKWLTLGGDDERRCGREIRAVELLALGVVTDHKNSDRIWAGATGSVERGM